MIENIKSNKDLFCTLLRMTKREGIESVIKNLDKMGFFEAPASAGHHLNEVGGLVQHSLNVANMATQIAADLIKIKPELKERLKEEYVCTNLEMVDVLTSVLLIILSSKA